MKIPQLRKKLEVKSCHNISWEDNYSWVHQKNILEVLKDGSKLLPEVREYLNEENKYTNFQLKVTTEIQKTIFKEIKARIKLEAGIQSGKTLRLRGKGLPSLNSYGNGDLLVHVNVWTPKTLNKEQRQFFEKMQGDTNFTPHPEKSEKSFFEKVKDMFA